MLTRMKSMRPERDPRIFGSRYWNNGDMAVAVAVVAVYGARCEYVCQVCGAMGELDPVPTCFHSLLVPGTNDEGTAEDYMELEGDWAAYIGACVINDYQERAENYAVDYGIKIEESLAYIIFAAEMETRTRMVYRR